MKKEWWAGLLAAISREGLKDSRVLENDRICSRHFISGKPAYLYDEANPDWLPTLHLGYAKKKANLSKKSAERLERKNEGEERSCKRNGGSTISTIVW